MEKFILIVAILASFDQFLPMRTVLSEIYTIECPKTDVLEVEPWCLPVFPIKSPPRVLGNKSLDKLIPRHLWIAVRKKDDVMNYQMPDLFARNKDWEVHIEGNPEKDAFMNTVFNGTSLLWAYNMLSPWAGAAKADIWRYAVLWSYGGAYIDDDSDMKTPLDKMIEPLDELIISYENNGYNGDGCYIPKYHLSDFYTLEKNKTTKAMNIFFGRIIPNWAIISAPRHPIIARTMENIVEIIRQEYFQEPVMRHLRHAYNWQLIMCGTGPSVLTGSAREVVIRNPPGLSYKLAARDFKDYGGKFKAVAVRPKNDPNHYMNSAHRKQNSQLLLSYVAQRPLTKELLLSWQGRAIQGQNGRQIYCLDHGKKRGIPNYDTFMALNFTMADVMVISDERMDGIETGEPMPSMDYTG